MHQGFSTWTFLISLSIAGSVWAKGRSDFLIRVDGQYAHHTTSPNTTASQRVLLFAEEKYTASSRWRIVASGQGWIESLYTNNFDYPNELRGEDFQDSRIQDGYAEYKRNRWLMRFGWQQVAWGETFGNFYADFINPKDLRYGIPQDIAQTRLGQPMANVKWVKGHSSLQALLLPQPAFNILPLPGSDYAPPIRLAQFPTVVVQRERQLQFGRDAEWGLRGSHTLGLFDTSLFYFNGFDRNPYYQIDPRTTLGNLIVNERHDRANYFGGAMAADIEGYLLRSEIVQTQGREMPIVLADNTTLSHRNTDELGYAISVDFPTWRRLNWSLQYSASQLRDNYKYLTARRHAQYLSARTMLGVFESSSWDTVLTYVTDDQSNRLQSSLTTPLQSNLELSTGLELYGGSSQSEFGRISRASRIFALLRFKYAD